MAGLWAGVQGLSHFACLSKSSTSWERDGSVLCGNRCSQRKNTCVLLIEMVPENSQTILKVSWNKGIPPNWQPVLQDPSNLHFYPLSSSVCTRVLLSPLFPSLCLETNIDLAFTTSVSKKLLKKQNSRLLAQASMLSIFQPYLIPLCSSVGTKQTPVCSHT